MAASIPNKALDKIEEQLRATAMSDDVNVYFVLGMPISDIGKGTFVAHLLSALPESDAVKFDGLLNTNANGRHTARGHDDFGIYEKYNPEKRFGDERYILGGYLFREFIDLYGEYENLCFRPHFYLYFVSKLQEIWRSIGKPKNYIVEVGGTIIDYEVDVYIPPAIYHFKRELGDRCKIVLLSELGWNGEYVKTRSIQRAVEELAKRFIAPDVILAREPQHMTPCSEEERVKNEKIIAEQVEQRIGVQIPLPHIISVPFYSSENIDDLGAYYNERLGHFLSNKSQLFIGSTNEGKIQDWENSLGSDYTITSPIDSGVSITVEEGMTSLRENAEKKAVAWAKASDTVAISDDTGFFINALDGAPGVCVKRWGGAFKKELSNAELLKHIEKKLKKHEDTSAYFETVYAVAAPDGRVFSVPFQNHGYIDTSLFEEAHEKGFPLSAVFKANGRDKTWAQMTPEERADWDAPMIKEIKRILQVFTPKT